jgi:hypothetical protein
MSEEQLAVDLTAAMKAREMPRVYVLRGVLTAVKNLKVERRGGALAEADLVQIVRREMRKCEEAEEYALKAGRDDVVRQNRAERAILAAYVPEQLDAGQLEGAIREIIAAPSARSLGAVMSALRERFAGRHDGRMASEIARRVLAEAAGR